MGRLRRTAFEPIFVRQLVTHIVLGIVVALLVGGLTIALIPQDNVPSGQIEETMPSHDPKMPVVHHSSALGISAPVLLNETPFVITIPWSTYREPLDWTKKHEYNSSFHLDGLFIRTENTLLKLRRSLNIPLLWYKETQFTLKMRNIYGSFSPRLNVSLVTDRIGNRQQVRTYTVSANTSETGRHVLRVMIPKIQKNFFKKTSEWAMSCSIEVGVTVPGRSSFVLEGLTVVANSTEKVCPVSFELRTSESESFFSNPIVTNLFVRPVLNISVDSRFCSFIGIHEKNETIYLPSGNYSVHIGWQDESCYYDIGELDFILSENDSIYIEIELPIYTLTINLSVKVPILEIVLFYTENNSPDLMHILYDFRTSGTHFPLILILPHIEGILHVSIKQRFTALGISSLEVEHQVPSATPHNLQLYVELPLFVVMNIALNVGQVYLVGFIIIFILVQIVFFQKSTRPHNWTFFKSDFRWFPMVILLVTLFVPWSKSLISFQHGLENFELHYIIMAYGALIFVNTKGSALVNIVNYYPTMWILFAGAVVPQYWTLRRVKSSRSWKWDWQYFAALSIPSLWASIIIILVSDLGTTTLLLGGYLPFFAPLSWIGIYIIHKVLKYVENRRHI